MRSFFSPEQTRAWLGGKRAGVGNLLAASLGVVTPFCSCSAIPLFIGFVESGIPLGVTFFFLTHGFPAGILAWQVFRLNGIEIRLEIRAKPGNSPPEYLPISRAEMAPREIGVTAADGAAIYR